MLKKEKQSRNAVGIDARGGYIYLRLRGKQTTERFQRVAEEHDRAIHKLRDQGRKVFVLVDASSLRETDMSPETRSAIRMMASQNIDGAAIVATGTMAGSLMSTTKIAAPVYPLQFFTRTRVAVQWIRQNLEAGWTYPVASLIAAIIIGLIGILGIIGWAADISFFKSFLAHERPINPVSALGLINLGVVFFAYYRGKLRLHHILGWVSIVLGLLELAHVPIDTLLFASKVEAAGVHAGISVAAAVCFICVGICALVSTTTKWPAKILGYVAVAVIVSITAFNIYGQLYAHDFIYSLSSNFVMSFNLAVTFLLSAIAGTILVFQRHRINLVAKISPLGWLIVVAVVALQVGGYAYWHQLNQRDTAESTRSFNVQTSRLTDTVNSRVTAYVNALHGLQGFFASSDNVSQKDFATYYDSLNLDTSYPGLRSIAFIAAAKSSDIPALTKKFRTDTSLFPGGNPTFTTGTLSNSPVHFFTLYFSNYSDLSMRYMGVDITTIPGRQDIYMAALQSDVPRASGTITFLQSPNQPAETGFFIVAPVHTSTSSAPIGVVNANFSYDIFFQKLFASELSDNDLSVQIRDGAEVIYQSASYASDSTSPYSNTVTIPIANRNWDMRVAAGSDFGFTGDKKRTQVEFIVSMLALSVLLIIMFIIQSRTRRRALTLASEITADLQHERRKTLESNQKDEAIISSIGDGLIAYDTDGTVERNNRMAERLFGVVEGGLIGKNLTRLTRVYSLDGEKLAPHDRPYALALKHKRPLSMKLYYERANGTRFPVELSVSPILLNGRVTGAIEVFHDITADMQLDRAKNEFVTLASHQLRTPLSAINWYSEMLLNGDTGALTAEQDAYIREISNGNTRMIELVNSLLDVSRLELGRMTFTPEDIDLSKLIDEQETEMRLSVTNKKLRFIKHVDAAIAHITNDRKMVLMVVQNLLSNALKYTNEGGTVEVTLRRATSQEVDRAHLPAADEYLLFSVKDNGFGIPANQQKRIFEKMFRADNVQTTALEGTGLGLYIVKQAVVQMGGWVGFESIEKKGSTFTVIAPVKAHEKAEKPGQA